MYIKNHSHPNFNNGLNTQSCYEMINSFVDNNGGSKGVWGGKREEG